MSNKDISLIVFLASSEIVFFTIYETSKLLKFIDSFITDFPFFPVFETDFFPGVTDFLILLFADFLPGVTDFLPEDLTGAFLPPTVDFLG